jgi:hypothetical protein
MDLPISEAERRRLSSELAKARPDRPDGHYLPDLFREMGLGEHKGPQGDGGEGPLAKKRRRVYRDIKDDVFRLGWIGLARAERASKERRKPKGKVGLPPLSRTR